MRTNKEKNPEKGVHLRTTPLTTLKVFASNFETMLTNMTRIKDIRGRFLSNYWLEDSPGAESFFYLKMRLRLSKSGS